MTLGIFFYPSQRECSSLLPLGPRTVYSPRKYVPPFAARHHIRIRLWTKRLSHLAEGPGTITNFSANDTQRLEFRCGIIQLSEMSQTRAALTWKPQAERMKEENSDI
jgi:hypothetical protein